MLQGIILIIVLTFHYINLNNIILALITLIGFYVGVKHIAMLVWFNFLYDLTFWSEDNDKCHYVYSE